MSCGAYGPGNMVLESDNGAPMSGATIAVTPEHLGILASFSRHGVSNDSPFSESSFKALKYRAKHPSNPFARGEAARACVASLVRWYNTLHMHSLFRFVTPANRHAGRDVEILAARQALYEAARTERPDRCSGPVCNWEPVLAVHLNSESMDLRQENRTAA